MEDLKILGARMAHHSPSPRPPLARSAARTASLTKSEPQPESGAAAAATKRPNETTDGWNGRKVVMTTAASGAKQLENEDAAADCQRGKGNFFPPLPKAGAI